MFIDYKHSEDGTIGEIEKNNFIPKNDIIVGNYIYTNGWSFEKVLNAIKCIVREEDDVTLQFFFLELQQFRERNKARTATEHEASTTATTPTNTPKQFPTGDNQQTHSDEPSNTAN